MGALSKVPDRGDPSDVLQLFPRFNLQVLCCRYWWLSRWEFRELSYPYWRVYHNSREGAEIIYDGKEYPLRPEKILMIAPNTSYSTHIENYQVPDIGYKLEGARIVGKEEEAFMADEKILHLFIHFNIGVPYDHISPGIFEFPLTSHLQEKLKIIKNHLMENYSTFDFYTLLSIHSLLSDMLSFVPESRWDMMSNDHRILQVLSYIESCMDGELSNKVLASKASLATNSFNRLFTEDIGIPPQKYVKKMRINRACALLHHSTYTIEQVANETGFADRYHFSKIFKNLTGLSPAMYRKEFGVKQGMAVQRPF